MIWSLDNTSILFAGVALLSWIFAWAPGLWCGRDVFQNEVVVPPFQLPTTIVPITEVITQAMLWYALQDIELYDLNPYSTIAYVVQAFAFPLWTYTFLQYKSKEWSLLLVIIAFVCGILIPYFTPEIDWVIVVPFIIHKLYDIYWTAAASFVVPPV